MNLVRVAKRRQLSGVIECDDKGRETSQSELCWTAGVKKLHIELLRFRLGVFMLGSGCPISSSPIEREKKKDCMIFRGEALPRRKLALSITGALSIDKG